MLTLAIETSCDETAAAVVNEKGKVLSNIIDSQAKEHAQTSGVVPEVAARRHAERIIPTINQALEKAHTTKEDIDQIAVTNKPGLLPALQVGVTAAKALAAALNKPLIPVNHIHAHVASVFSHDPKPEFPLVSLLVSGGHTELSLYESETKHRTLGKTRDDAAGEAFDKIARLLDLPYPGGPEISKHAEEGDKNAYTFARPMMHDKSDDFSFSGLKTEIKRTTKEIEHPTEQQINDIAASAQAAIVDVLVAKTVRVTIREHVSTVVLAGGVAANSLLRIQLKEKLEAEGITLHIPETKLCGDNAAMIGIAAQWEKPKPIESVQAVPTKRKKGG